MKTATAVCMLAAVAYAQNPLARPDPFTGTFQGNQVTLEITGAQRQYSGWLTVQGNKFPVTGKAGNGNVTGVVQINGGSYSFTLTPTGAGLKLATEGAEYTLARMAETPGSPPEPARKQPSSGSIVGSWRNATGSARFNSDGTGVVDGQAGRYEIRDNQLTLIGAQGRVTLPFEVAGDRLTLTVNGAVVVLNRVREESGAGSIHAELVGKWCWISITTAQQGGRQSSQCITLEPSGAYSYVGGSDNYSPYGGVTSQSADSGTWTATETTLTARSRSGKTTVYALEKRNHPKNKDPMIVLNGQTFVTYFNKPPW
jgi:hypothetical protein